MAQRRSGADEVRRGVFERVNTEFDYQRIKGLTSKPPITQNPTRRTAEPFIYIYSLESEEVDNTNDNTSRMYTVMVDVVTRYNSYGGGQRQVNRMVDEVVGAVRYDDYPDITSRGYSIYNLTIGTVENHTFLKNGAKYYQASIPVYVTAVSVDLPSEVNPVQALLYSLSGFTYEPQNNKIEAFDSGLVTLNTSYPSANNGWDFTSVSYTIAHNADGTLDDNLYTIGTLDEPLGIDGILSYEFASDNTTTTSINSSVVFNRIRSTRFGSSTSSAFNATDITTLANFNIMYGTENPKGSTFTIEPEVGEYPYIMFDEQYDSQIGEIKGPLGLNEISAFTKTNVGGFTIYILTDPIPYAGLTLTYTLN